MIGQKRVMAVVIAVVAIALTVFGIVLAATDPNPADIGKDPLALNGYPPHSADLAVSLSTSGGLGLNDRHRKLHRQPGERSRELSDHRVALQRRRADGE
jgi:hypothetical protein